MSKILKKLVKKWAFLSGVIVGLVIAATVVGIFVGFNGMATVESGKKVVVSVDPNIYQVETSKEDIKAICDKALDGELYVLEGDDGSSGQLIYAFDEDANVSKAVEALNATFKELTKDGAKYATLTLHATEVSEEVKANYAEGYVVRAAIAGVVLSVLAFAYVAIRHNWRMGSVAAICVAASMLLTGAIVIVTRIPVTVSVAYAIMLAGLATAINVLFVLNKLRAALKSEDASKDVEELVVSSVAVKEIAVFSAILGVAILLVGIPAGATAAWFAVSAFVGVVVSAAMGLIYAPALCYPMQQAIAAKEASATKHGYKGAKKGEKPAPKAEPKKEEVKKEEPKKEEVAPVTETKEEAPVEEKAEEVEEAPVEEVELSEEDLAAIDAAFDDADAE